MNVKPGGAIGLALAGALYMAFPVGLKGESRLRDQLESNVCTMWWPDADCLPPYCLSGTQPIQTCAGKYYAPIHTSCLWYERHCVSDKRSCPRARPFMVFDAATLAFLGQGDAVCGEIQGSDPPLTSVPSAEGQTPTRTQEPTAPAPLPTPRIAGPGAGIGQAGSGFSGAAGNCVGICPKKGEAPTAMVEPLSGGGSGGGSPSPSVPSAPKPAAKKDDGSIGVRNDAGAGDAPTVSSTTAEGAEPEEAVE